VARGDAERAILALEHGADVAEQWDVADNTLGIDLLLGVAYATAGRVDDALQVVERGTAELTRMRTDGQAPPWEANRMFAETYLLSGRIRDAEQCLRLALDHMRATRRYTAEADCLWLLGEIEARRDQPNRTRAETCFHEALALAEEHELRPLQAHCHLGLGKLNRRTCRMDEARAELSVAVTMLREMGMTFWLPEDEQALAAAHG
jgi:tetratricopeptide (TPR) repeat protein